jgi:hypothetical protein
MVLAACRLWATNTCLGSEWLQLCLKLAACPPKDNNQRVATVAGLSRTPSTRLWQGHQVHNFTLTIKDNQIEVPRILYLRTRMNKTRPCPNRCFKMSLTMTFIGLNDAHGNGVAKTRIDCAMCFCYSLSRTSLE